MLGLTNTFAALIAATAARDSYAQDLLITLSVVAYPIAGLEWKTAEKDEFISHPQVQACEVLLLLSKPDEHWCWPLS